MGKIETAPRYTCDLAGCGAEVPEEQMVSFRLEVAVTGIPGVGSFGCDQGQHYGCCPEHAFTLALQCLQAHLPAKRQALVAFVQAKQAAAHTPPSEATPDAEQKAGAGDGNPSTSEASPVS